MKKVILNSAIMCAFVLVTACCGGSSDKTSWEQDGLYGKVKSSKSSIYTAKMKFGEVQKEDLDKFPSHPVFYDINSSISITKYNAEGMKNIVENYNYYGDLVTKSLFEFKGKNLTSVKTYNDNGEITFERNLIYDDKSGNVKEQFINSFSSYHPYSSHHVFSYEKDGTVTSEIYEGDSLKGKSTYKEIKKNGKLQQFIQGNTIINYDDDEKVLSVIIIDSDTTIYSYNKNGDIESVVKTTYEYKDEDIDFLLKKINDSTLVYDTIQPSNRPQKIRKMKEYKFEYEYDKHKNWITRTTFEGMKPLFIEEREIEYYN